MPSLFFSIPHVTKTAHHVVSFSPPPYYPPHPPFPPTPESPLLWSGTQVYPPLACFFPLSFFPPALGPFHRSPHRSQLPPCAGGGSFSPFLDFPCPESLAPRLLRKCLSFVPFFSRSVWATGSIAVFLVPFSFLAYWKPFFHIVFFGPGFRLRASTSKQYYSPPKISVCFSSRTRYP